MMFDDFADEPFLIHPNFASPADIKIFKRYRKQVSAMDTSESFYAGYPRSRISDPFQIGSHIHHALLMN